jgi:hypothetical protein
MKPETGERFLQLWEALGQQVGLDMYVQMRKVDRLIQRYGRASVAFCHAAGSRQRMRAYLKKLEEPPPEQLEKFLALLQSLPAILRTAMVQYAAQLPRHKQGRKPAVTPDVADKACADVYALIGQGRNQSQALKEVRERYNIAPRTMYRLWGGWQEARKALISPLTKKG